MTPHTPSPAEAHAGSPALAEAPASVTNDAIAALLGTRGLMAILRSVPRERAVEMARAAWALGIDSVEVTIQSERDLEALEAVVAAAEGRPVGAGTVLSARDARQAAAAGAAFAVSPGFDARVVEACAAAGVVPLPGVATASEVQAAHALGLRWVKAFPAQALGASWFTAMRGPFPEMNFVATGGMDADNAAEFHAAGVRVVAVGSALADPRQLELLAALPRPA